jgi:hypothetical protein
MNNPGLSPAARGALGSLALLLWAACAGAPPPPPEFGSLGQGSPEKFRALSPDGVLYAVHTVKNKPKADLAFWRDALKTRMTQAGYRVLGDSSIAGAGETYLLRLAAPLGQKDYLYFVALSMRGKEIRVAEAAGEAARFRAHEDALLKALAGP